VILRYLLRRLVEDLTHNYFLETGARNGKLKVYETVDHPAARADRLPARPRRRAPSRVRPRARAADRRRPDQAPGPLGILLGERGEGWRVFLIIAICVLAVLLATALQVVVR
jgi:hypothetical protein